MSSQGIFPDRTLGSVVVRSLPAPAGVTNAYVPPGTFTLSSPITFYGSDCTIIRFDPQQLNAFESEMVALAVAMFPTGTWNSGSVTNLANAFLNFTTHWAGGGSGGGESVALSISTTYPNANASDTTAATPGFVTAAVVAGIVTAVGQAELGVATSITTAQNAAVSIAEAYTDTSVANITAGSETYANTVAATAQAAAETFATAQANAAQATAEAFTTTTAAATLASAEAFTSAAIGPFGTPISLAHAASYPADIANDALATTPAYVTNQVNAAISTAETTAETFASTAIATALTTAEGYTNNAVIAILAVHTAYPADAASDTLAATPAYVGAAIAAIPANGGGAALATSPNFPADAASDTLAATPAYVAAAISAIPGGSGGSGGTVYPPFYEAGPFAPPTPSWFDFSSASIATQAIAEPNAGMWINAASNGNQNGNLCFGRRNVTSWAVPWTVTTRLVLGNWCGDNMTCGISIEDTNGKFVHLTWQTGAGTSILGTQKWNSNTSYNSSYNSGNSPVPPRFFKVTYDGTNLIFGASHDGFTWELFTQPALDFLSDITYVGIGGNNNGEDKTQLEATAFGILCTYYDDPDHPFTQSLVGISGVGAPLAVAADYPADITNDASATTPAYVAAALANVDKGGWVNLTFNGAPVTIFGQSGVLISDQIFNLVDGSTLCIESFVHGVSGDICLLGISADTLNGYFIDYSAAGNQELYTCNNSGANITNKDSSGLNWQYTGTHIMLLQLQLCSSSLGSLIGGTVDMYGWGINSNDTYPSGPARVYVLTDDITKTSVRARLGAGGMFI